MIETTKTVLILILLIYGIITTVLYWVQYDNLQNYQSAKDKQLSDKESELNKRESIVVDKEICFRELTRLKTIQESALDILKSYSITTPEQLNNKLNSK